MRSYLGDKFSVFPLCGGNKEKKEKKNEILKTETSWTNLGMWLSGMRVSDS